MNKRSQYFSITLFLLYVAILCWILLWKLGVSFSYMSSRSYNLIPFQEAFTPSGKLDKMELILNVLIFIPFGVYTAMVLYRSTLMSRLLFIAGSSFMFEALQYTLRIGAFDSTDIVTNTIGGLLGLLFYELFCRLMGDRPKAQIWMNRLAAAGTFIFILLLILLKLGKLPIRYQ